MEKLVKAYTNTLAAEFFYGTEGEDGSTFFYETIKEMVEDVCSWAEANKAPISWLYNVGDILYPMQGAVIWMEGARPIV